MTGAMTRRFLFLAAIALGLVPIASRVDAGEARPPLDPRGFEAFGRKLGQEIPARTRRILYQTWTYPEPPWMIEDGGEEHRRFSQLGRMLVRGYQRLPRLLHAEIAPVGPAWERVRQAHPDIEMFAEDHKHASQAGAYLNALVIYGRLFGALPTDPPARLYPYLQRKDVEKYGPFLEITTEQQAALIDAAVAALGFRRSAPAL